MSELRVWFWGMLLFDSDGQRVRLGLCRFLSTLFLGVVEKVLIFISGCFICKI